jgi:carboxypeptidase Taq
VSDAHEALREHLQSIHALDRTADVLRWDQETTMPPGGIEARAGELAKLATIQHDAWIGEDTEQLLERARSQAETGPERALVRETSRIRERKVRVPEELIEEITEATSRAQAAWEQAKRDDDFEPFADHLERVVGLKHRYADAIDPDRRAYAVLFEDFEPWMDLDDALAIVDDVAEGARELLAQAPEPGEQASEDALAGPWPEDTQRALLEELLATLGYDFDRGVLGDAEHPFSIGNRHDARIATNLHSDDLMSGLTSTVHEFGHALYTQGLPEHTFGTPLGASRDLVVHEANSRLWENHVARSRAFWRELAPRLEGAFDRPVDPEAGWRAANVVQPSLIRVDADEISYHLHIKLRVELERELIRGELAVDELPQRWNDEMEALLGVRPDNDREGVLQDVHWSHGSIGYFPTYTLGSALAAQFTRALANDVGPLAKLVREGRYGEIAEWLGTNVHQHGSRYKTNALIERATGSELSAEAFLGHARERFGRLWDAEL